MECTLRKRWQDDRQVLFHGCWLLVSDQTVWGSPSKSLHRHSDPDDYREINSCSAVVPPWYIIALDRTHGALVTHVQMHNCGRVCSHKQIRRIGIDSLDLAASTCVPLLSAPVSSPPSSKHSFAILSKASLMPPITWGLQSRQIWSGEAWQESLLRIRAF